MLNCSIAQLFAYLVSIICEWLADEWLMISRSMHQFYNMSITHFITKVKDCFWVLLRPLVVAATHSQEYCHELYMNLSIVWRLSRVGCSSSTAVCYFHFERVSLSLSFIRLFIIIKYFVSLLRNLYLKFTSLYFPIIIVFNFQTIVQYYLTLWFLLLCYFVMNFTNSYLLINNYHVMSLISFICC